MTYKFSDIYIIYIYIYIYAWISKSFISTLFKTAELLQDEIFAWVSWTVLFHGEQLMIIFDDFLDPVMCSKYGFIKFKVFKGHKSNLKEVIYLCLELIERYCWSITKAAVQNVLEQALHLLSNLLSDSTINKESFDHAEGNCTKLKKMRQIFICVESSL